MDNPETHAMLGTGNSTNTSKPKGKTKKNVNDYQHGPD
jgi:hypothetical protein